MGGGTNEHYSAHTSPAQRGARKGRTVVHSAVGVSSSARSKKAETQVGWPCWRAAVWAEEVATVIGVAKGRRKGASILSGSRCGPGAKGVFASSMLATDFMLEV